jgi:hypothetical protein
MGKGFAKKRYLENNSFAPGSQLSNKYKINTAHKLLLPKRYAITNLI